MAWFEHGTSRIYFEVQGDGAPVLVLPGWFRGIEEFSSLRDALVVSGYQVIAADLPGPVARNPCLGRTAPPPMKRMLTHVWPCSSTWRAFRHT